MKMFKKLLSKCNQTSRIPATGFRKILPLFLIALLAACLTSATTTSAPDPTALKVQGADTIGNAVQTIAVPPGATGISQTALATSNNAANTAQNVTLTGAANTTVYVSGIQVMGSGATAGSVINVTISPVIGGTMNYALVVPTGVTTSITPLVVTFNPPLPCNALNTGVTLSVPAFGAGNTNQTASIQGFRQ